MNVQNISIATNPQYLASTRDIDNVRAARLAKDNDAVNGAGAVTPYGRVVGGTVLARDSAGKDHPCRLTEATDAVSAANAVIVADVRNFRVGDKVSVAAGPTLGATFAAGAGSATLTVVPKVGGLNIVIAVSGTTTPYSASYDDANKTITIVSATDGGDAATTTLETIVEALKTTFGGLIASASTSSGIAIAAATASTALGTVAFEAIAADREVTLINTSTSTLTLNGGAFSAGVGAVVYCPDAYVPSGICDQTVSTVEYIDATEYVNEKTVPLRVGGDVRTDGSVVGANGDGLLRRALSGQVWPDPANGGALRTSHQALVGFRFVNV